MSSTRNDKHSLFEALKASCFTWLCGSYGRFVGEVNELPSGYWVGVVFDEPVGKNDGSYQGIRHFTCEPGYGGFARPKNVLIGDYPPLDILEEI